MKCGEIKSIDAFQDEKRNKSGKRSECKACTRLYQREHSRNNKEMVNARNRRYYHNRRKDDPVYLKRSADRVSARRYGLSLEEYRAIKDNAIACDLCDDVFEDDDSVKCIDHCHETGVIRGVLCHRCNVDLGGYERLVKVKRLSAYR